ncbi:hypothetical protein KBB96_10645 [Luteolibacter ambystomatis]|uniref:Uncharacterized protein n=1 Tax=Luteolibacter ambystomatis TaxID=2824561 RepID=A0A975G6T5_9BACT|nr:hypothetical protein [Luteolibacter ambystomatis]QUE49330.1 hypothetical protein KBB96_10645 [Luteolibacter ambystomatis]
MPAGAHIHAGKILLAKARLAAQAGDETEALRLTGLVGNLADRLHDLDVPNLQTETASLGLERVLQQAIVRHFLPTIGKQADLKRWRPLIEREGRYDPQELAKVMRGEFHTTSRDLLLPMILDERNRLRPRDGMAVARAYAASFDQWVRSMDSAGLKDLQADPGLEQTWNNSHASAEGRRILDTLFVSSPAWSKGFVRMSYRAGLNHTVLDLAAAEQRGERVEERGKELSGGAYVFDSPQRMVSLSASIAVPGVEPVALPW